MLTGSNVCENWALVVLVLDLDVELGLGDEGLLVGDLQGQRVLLHLHQHKTINNNIQKEVGSEENDDI